MTVTTESFSGAEIVELCRRHTLFEWSAQSAVDPIPVERYRSYRARTAGALTLTVSARRAGAERGIPGGFGIPDLYHGIQRRTETVDELLSRAENVLELEGARTVAAIIIEPVVGTNGI